MKSGATPDRWLLLIHHLPAKPAYLRVKIGRRLQALGAVAVKNTVYVLPMRRPLRAALEGVARDLATGGGGAVVCQAQFILGLTDEEIRAAFNAARDVDYDALASDARRLAQRGDASPAELTKLDKRRNDIGALDFFGARGRQAVDEALAALEARAR